MLVGFFKKRVFSKYNCLRFYLFLEGGASILNLLIQEQGEQREISCLLTGFGLIPGFDGFRLPGSLNPGK